MYMAFFSSAITTLKTLVVAIGAGLGVWGVVNLLEGYGNDNQMCIRDRICLLYYQVFVGMLEININSAEVLYKQKEKTINE